LISQASNDAPYGAVIRHAGGDPISGLNLIGAMPDPCGCRETKDSVRIRVRTHADERFQSLQYWRPAKDYERLAAAALAFVFWPRSGPHERLSTSVMISDHPLSVRTSAGRADLRSSPVAAQKPKDKSGPLRSHRPKLVTGKK
jgi:hypothetical protein